MRFNGKTVAAVDIEAGTKTPHRKELLQAYAPFLGIHQALSHSQPLHAADEDIAAFSFQRFVQHTLTSLLNLEARDVKREDVVVLPYATHGVQLYGNVIIASPKLIAEKPEALRAFLKDLAKSAKEAMAEQVSKAYATKNPVSSRAVWNGSFLPSAAELDILPKR